MKCFIYYTLCDVSIRVRQMSGIENFGFPSSRDVPSKLGILLFFPPKAYYFHTTMYPTNIVYYKCHSGLFRCQLVKHKTIIYIQI